jgi:hypothetical protein
MYTLSDNYTIKETLLNNTKLLFNRAGWADALSLLFTFTRRHFGGFTSLRVVNPSEAK